MEAGKRKGAPLRQTIFDLMSVRETGVVIPLIAMTIAIGSVNPTFLTFENLVNVLRSTSFTFIVGIGMTIVLVSAGLDLSIGSVFALGGIAAGFALAHGVPVPLSVLLGILAGALIGVANGAIVVKLGIPPFITTLGMLYMARGLVLVWTRGVPIYPLPKSFNAIGQDSLCGIPYVVIIALALGLAGSFLLKRTTYGRAVYAIGGNEETARLSGIRVDRLKFSFYAIVGALATFAGTLQAARLGTASPGVGQGFELEVIASVIIGGTSLFGGAGTIADTFLGALFMTVLKNGMSLVRVSPYWQQLVIGAIIILAVGVDQYRRRKNR